jgi:hypothetical protein
VINFEIKSLESQEWRLYIHLGCSHKRNNNITVLDTVAINCIHYTARGMALSLIELCAAGRKVFKMIHRQGSFSLGDRKHSTRFPIGH